MASVTFFVGDVLPTRSVGVHPAVRPTRKWTALELRRATAEFAGNFLVLGMLGWETWRIGGRLLQLGILLAAGVTGSESVAHTAESFWPASGTWPWCPPPPVCGYQVWRLECRRPGASQEAV
jgi:hypothetical protein